MTSSPSLESGEIATASDVMVVRGEHEHIHIYLGIDYGTSSCKFAYQIKHRGTHDKTVHRIQLDYEEFELPSVVAYHDGELHCGLELINLVRYKNFPADKVIQFSKMAIHDESDNIPFSERTHLSRHIVEQLEAASKTLQDILNDHMKAIIAIITDRLRLDPVFHLLPTNTGNAHLHFSARLTVPHQWNALGHEMMHTAAAAADIAPVVLASEPQCALAEYLTVASVVELGVALCTLRKGSLIIANDLGCGTSDVVVYRLLDDMGPRSRLQAMQKSSGALCGSQQINEKVYQYILESIRSAGDTVEAVCARLSMTYGSFRWHALEAIEGEKKNFPDKRTYTVTVDGDNGTGVRYFDVPALAMKQAHDEVIKDILALNKEILTRANEPDLKPNAVLLLGGFASSKYLRKIFFDTYNPQGIDVFGPQDFRVTKNASMVALGALSHRFEQIAVQGLPTKYAYAFLLDQPYSRKIHDDCLKDGITELGRPSRRLDPRKLISTTISNPTEPRSKKMVRYAPDRIVNVILKGDSTVGTDPDFTQEYFTPVADPVIQTAFVVMTHNRPTGSPARDNTHHTIGPLLDGIMPWGTVHARVDKKLLEDAKVEKCKVHGEIQYRFTATLVVVYTGEQDITVGWEIQKRNGKTFKVMGDRKVWDGTRSTLVEDQDHAEEESEEGEADEMNTAD
jgi:hypothetical protein